MLKTLSNKIEEMINKKIIKYNHLIAVLLTFHNAYSMTEALIEMEKEGMVVPAHVVSSLSPYRTRHVRRIGEFQVPEHVSRSIDFDLRPEVANELVRSGLLKN